MPVLLGGNAQQQQRGVASTGAQVSWFMGARVSKVLTIVSVTAFVLAEAMGEGSDRFALDMDLVLREAHLHRLFTSHLSFGTFTEFFIGLGILVPNMRRFEREMGSRKFGTFVAMTTLVATVWQVMFSQILPEIRLAPGPYALLGSTLLLFYRYTPRLYPKFFSFLGFDFSEKSITYLFATQLVIVMGGLGSLLPTLSGVIAALLWCMLPFLRRMELPELVYRAGDGFASIFVENQLPPVVFMSTTLPANMLTSTTTSSSARRRAQHRAAEVAGAHRPRGVASGRQQQQHPLQNPFANSLRQVGGGLDAAAAAAPMNHFQELPPAAPASDDAINQLMAMGFERDAIVRALGRSDNNVEVAANRLLSGE